MVLLMVIMIIIVMSIFVTLYLSQNMSQTFSSQERIDQIKAMELSQGAYWKAYMDKATGNNPTAASSETMDGKKFTPGISSSVVNGTATQYSTPVNY